MGPALISSSELRLLGDAQSAKLGEGTYCVCWLASLNGEQVAVKWLRPEVLKIPRELACIIQEVHTLAQLQHRHIVGLIGVGTTGASGSAIAPEFLVTELCDGGSLAEVVERAQAARLQHRTVYQEADALRWAVQLAAAVEHLHSRSPMVIHRDIKLSNVLLRGAHPSTSEAVLADFGLHAVVSTRSVDSSSAADAIPSRSSDTSTVYDAGSRAVGGGAMHVNALHAWTAGESLLAACQKPRGARSSVDWSPAPPPAAPLTPPQLQQARAAQAAKLTGQTGSLGYMAPEVYLRHHYDERADVFSFGVLLWELLHQVPLQASVCAQGRGALEAYAERMACEGLRPPMRESMDPALAALIRACWAQSPAMRPSMREVLAVLRHAAAAREAGRPRSFCMPAGACLPAWSSSSSAAAHAAGQRAEHVTCDAARTEASTTANALAAAAFRHGQHAQHEQGHGWAGGRAALAAACSSAPLCVSRLTAQQQRRGKGGRPGSSLGAGEALLRHGEELGAGEAEDIDLKEGCASEGRHACCVIS